MYASKYVAHFVHANYIYIYIYIYIYLRHGDAILRSAQRHHSAHMYSIVDGTRQQIDIDGRAECRVLFIAFFDGEWTACAIPIDCVDRTDHPPSFSWPALTTATDQRSVSRPAFDLHSTDTQSTLCTVGLSRSSLSIVAAKLSGSGLSAPFVTIAAPLQCRRRAVFCPRRERERRLFRQHPQVQKRQCCSPKWKSDNDNGKQYKYVCIATN